ncbi:helix-turn-helix transcriptional regulator [Pumilibacter muris]|jgi:transcriptional regulator with XRE-family HTH domain|uniref:helix-turn-helix transcriptional regulator n=1 Tax=Pumilibacter muris TaxID=2941510 RepID=UPI0023BA2402|nr:helix-turn-helix transcriptional regulator [Pumilibacter muris]
MRERLRELIKEKEAFKQVFCKRLVEIRTERKLLQRQMAEKLGVNLSTYSNWEQGRRAPHVNDIYNMLLVLEIDANDLFDLE